MRPARDIPIEDVTAFLRARFGDEVSDVTPVARQGFWSRAFHYRTSSEELIVRFSNVRENFDRDAFAARYASPGLPIPRIAEIGEAFDGHFAVSTFAAGRLLDGVDEGELARTLPSLFAALDAVRQIDLSATSGYGYWDANGRGIDGTWDTVMLGGIPRWRTAVGRSPVGLASFDAGVTRMKALLPFSPPIRHLVHGDLLHHNVLVDNGRVTALLDWGSGFIGDFVYDIAWLTFWQPWYPNWPQLDFAAAARAHYAAIGLVVDHFDERLRCYELRIAVSNQEWFAMRGDRPNLERVVARTWALAGSA